MPFGCAIADKHATGLAYGAGPRPGSPRVEQLEERRLLSVSYVDNPGDYSIDQFTHLAGDWLVLTDTNGILDAGDMVQWQKGVGDSIEWGNDAFGTIQAAITAADPAGTINIAPGTFSETLTINKSLTLLGSGIDGADATLINPNAAYGYGIAVNSATADVTLRGMTVSNTGLGGISFVGNTLTVQAAKVEGGVLGINLASGGLDVSNSWVRATNSDPTHVGVFG